MTTEELRAAAERLREHRRVMAAMEHPRNSPYTYVEVSTGAAGFVHEAELKDMATVVTAYLAEHPADGYSPLLRARLDLQAAQQQLAYLWNDTGSCPCGARRESPQTHPHIIGCPTAAVLKETP
jgi:hypothetical protein